MSSAQPSIWHGIHKWILVSGTSNLLLGKTEAGQWLPLLLMPAARLGVSKCRSSWHTQFVPQSSHETLLNDTRGGSEVSRLLTRQSGGFLWIGAIWGSGILQDTDDGEGLCSSQGTCECLGNPFQPAQPQSCCGNAKGEGC